MSLFWRVFTANAALLTAATVVLGVSPVTVSWPIVVTEAVVLGLGLVGMLAVNAVLLRLAFAPLTTLAGRMSQVDLLDQPHPLAAGHVRVPKLLSGLLRASRGHARRPGFSAHLPPGLSCPGAARARADAGCRRDQRGPYARTGRGTGDDRRVRRL